jgi:hypothetical protein
VLLLRPGMGSFKLSDGIVSADGLVVVTLGLLPAVGLPVLLLPILLPVMGSL